jgi:hypothetical protein
VGEGEPRKFLNTCEEKDNTCYVLANELAFQEETNRANT